ncbi:MAG: CAP domain-containing protein [Pseudomonadota bacterium]
MLQKYDKLKSTSLLALAAAGGFAFSPAALANIPCQASDGYGTALPAYVSEATACIKASDLLNAALSDALFDQVNADRQSADLPTLQRRTSLDQAAAAHALDMAERSYAAHTDLENRDHLYRIRAFDRSMLFGSTGANVVQTAASEDAAALYAAIKQDSLNAANLVRDGFSDVGIAVAVKDGKAYIVQVFATVEGELKTQLPLSLTGSTTIHAEFMDKDSEAVGWGLIDPRTGELVADGKAPRVQSNTFADVDTAALDILISTRTGTYVFKGPLVSAD